MTPSAIQRPPVAQDHGLEFNYAAWTAGTTVQFANVPWNSDYRDIVRFDDRGKLDAYLAGQNGSVVTLTGLTYARVGVPVRVSLPFHAVYRYNYLRVFNPAQPVPGGDTPRAYYYFITDVVYRSPNATEVHVQLDVWQTFGHDVTFGNCYIERGHVGIANQESFTDYGREFLTIPEGLDVGSEYRVEKRWTRKFGTARTSENGVPIDTDNPRVLIATTVSFEGNPGTVESPNLNSAKGSMYENLPNGAELYVCDSIGEFKSFMEFMTSRPWITQGIISVMAFPKAFTLNTTDVTVNNGAGGTLVIKKLSSGDIKPLHDVLAANWRDAIQLGRYARLRKFLTYPFCVLEVTAYNGTPLILKPESWQTGAIELVSFGHFAPPSPRMMTFPFRYNAGSEQVEYDRTGEIVNDGAEFLDLATGITNFPQFSVVNNSYMSFMAANANSIAFQNQTADWSQQKSLAGNQASYDVASKGIEASQAMSQLGQNVNTAQTALANQTAAFQALKSAGQGVVGGAMAGGGAGAVIGGAAGMVAGAVGTAITVNQNNQSLAIANSAAQQGNAITTGAQAFTRDTNRDLADWAARGDYQNSIAAINAKVQDARLTQPTTAGQMGGDAFNLATHRWGIDVKVKLISSAAMRAVGEYWLRYGYAVQQFGRVPASLMVMEKFTYWKLRETYVTSSACPETFRQAIRGIFEKGVTVWKDPGDIGNIDIADNAPLAGVTL